MRKAGAQMQRGVGVQGAGAAAPLERVLLEGIGAAARSLGAALRDPGSLLRLVLLPTLERFGAPCTPAHLLLPGTLRGPAA